MSELKTMKCIIVDYLKSNGFDGLCGDFCGCGIDYLAPCESGPINCYPAYKIPRHCAECKTPCDAYDTDHPEGFCYSTIKPEGHTPRTQCGEAQGVTCAECEEIKPEIIKEEFEKWEADDADEREFLAHGFYGGFRAAEPLVKIKVLEEVLKRWENMYCQDRESRETAVRSMIAELKEVKR